MNKNDIKRIQRKKEVKAELDYISNKSLTMFTVSLMCGIVLLFLYSAFQGYGSHTAKVQGFVTSMAIIGGIGFLGLMIASFITGRKESKKKIAVSLRNWGIVSLVIGIASAYIYPVDLIVDLFKVIGMENKGGALAVKVVNGMGTVAIKRLLIALVIYVVVMFVYYQIKANKIKNKK